MRALCARGPPGTPAAAARGVGHAAASDADIVDVEVGSSSDELLGGLDPFVGAGDIDVGGIGREEELCDGVCGGPVDAAAVDEVAIFGAASESFSQKNIRT